MKTMRLRTALLGSGAAIAMIAASGAAGADELSDLRSQIEALQGKVAELEAKQSTAGSPNVAPAAAVEAGDKPRSWKLPGTNTSMNIGGYAKLDFIYDLNQAAGDTLGTPAADNTPTGRTQNQFRLHARQSRLWVKTWTPTDWGELATHIEGDFFGNGGNQLVSNSNSFRLRHAYGRLGPVLAGQTWTNFMNLRAFPETIDFAGPVGLPFLRQAQVRYSADFGGGTTLDLALENPNNGVVVAAGTVPVGLAAASGRGLATSDHLPDFTARLTHAWSGGHVALAGVARYASIENSSTTGVAFNDSQFGWALAPSGAISLGETDTVGAYFIYGQGGGRYQISSFVTDFAVNGTTVANISMEPVTHYGGSAWWRHQWTDTIRSNVAFGYQQINVEDEITKANIPAGTLDRQFTTHVNLIWSPVPQVNIGLEYSYRNSSFHNTTSVGQASRIQAGFQYQF